MSSDGSTSSWSTFNLELQDSSTPVIGFVDQGRTSDICAGQPFSFFTKEQFDVMLKLGVNP